MTRRDLLAAAALAAVLLGVGARVLASPGAVFFNHGDLFTYHWPLRALTAAALAEGRLPFWNPWVLLGVPHAANPQAVLFYPPALLGAVLPMGRALTLDQLGHLLWACLGAFLLARQGRLGRGPAAALAAAYALSPFLVFRVAAGIPTLLASLAWAPWAWLAWAAGAPFLLAAVFALQFLSGHPQFLLANAAAMALWAAVRRDRVRLLSSLAGGAAVSLLLAAAQWPGLVELLRGSNRAGWPAEFAASYSLEPRFLLRWLLPPLLPTPVDPFFNGLASVYYESAGVWLGTALLVAALGGALVGRARLGPLVLAGTGLLLALGANGPLASLLALPGAGYLRTPSRWSFLVLWALWLLAGAGLAWATRQRAYFAALAAPLVLAELLVFDGMFLKPMDADARMRASPQFAALGGRDQRVLTDPELANPNKTILYRVRNANGYDAFYPSGAALWAAEAEGKPAADSSRVLVSNWRSDAAARAGVAAYVSPRGLEKRGDAWPLAAFAGPDGRRLRPDPTLVVERPERWRITGEAPRGAAALVLAEARWPGWRARLAGAAAELRPWGPAFSAVPLDGRGGPVELTYEFLPTGWPWWALLSACAWAGWLGLAARRAGALA